jgi:hypothetical protein
MIKKLVKEGSETITKPVTKPGIKPTTKPGYPPSPIRREKPSVMPGPKATVEEVTERFLSLIKL